MECREHAIVVHKTNQRPVVNQDADPKISRREFSPSSKIQVTQTGEYQDQKQTNQTGSKNTVNPELSAMCSR